MPQAERHRLEELRARIATLERRIGPGIDTVGMPRDVEAAGMSLGAEAAPGPLDLVTRSPGLLHEVFADDPRLSGSALGFGLGLARPLLTPRRPALLYLQLSQETRELGLPFAPGFERMGIAARQVVFCRVEGIADFLWALEEAIACRAIAAVVAEIAGANRLLDFTLSRRLTLRIAATRTTTLLLRYGTSREASAARLRWHVAPGLSAAPPFDPLAPGTPRFAVTLEKSRLGARAQQLEGRSFELDWTDHGFVVVERDGAGRPVAARPAAASRPQPAPLGHRLSEAG